MFLTGQMDIGGAAAGGNAAPAKGGKAAPAKGG